MTPPENERTEARLMILPPPPCSTKRRAAAWLRYQRLLRLIFTTSSQSSSPNSSAGDRRMMPALLTRMSSRPSSAAHSPMICAACSGSVFRRSWLMAWHRLPIFSICSRVSSRGTTSSTATSAPASARPTARAWPRPRPAPVTSATRPSSLKSSRIVIVEPSVAEVQRLDALFLAELEVALQLGEDVVLVDQVVLIVYILHRPLEDEERDHVACVFIHHERVDVTRRLVDERTGTRHPVPLQVVPGALDAVTKNLSPSVAVAGDLSAP